MPPTTSAHGVTTTATWRLSTSTRKASTSMSKRAPSADTVRVRRATCPSTPSSASATEARTTSVTTGVPPLANRSATSAATPPTSTARASVTKSAGPSSVEPALRAAPASSVHRPTAYPVPASQPSGPRSTAAASTASSTSCAAAPAASCRSTRSRIGVVEVRNTSGPRMRWDGGSPESVEDDVRHTPSEVACAFWLRAPGQGEIRSVELAAPGPDDVVVQTLFSGVSRGTETLVFRGGVPAGQRARMRAPFQEGEFPGPVKYGYLNVGVVEEGPDALRGRAVFCLYPHQTRYVVPAHAVTPVPDTVPP